MLNKYPLWKTLMVLFIVAFGALFALPNIYGKDPAVQISGLRGVEVNLASLDNVKSQLTAGNVSFLSIVLDNDQLLVRFTDTEQQLRARDLLDENLGDK